MPEQYNPAAEEAAKMEASKKDQEQWLNSKDFQAANRLYQIESQGGSVQEVLAKDPTLKALVDKAFADKRWNPEGLIIDQVHFSQEDQAKTQKFGKEMTSWTDNPVARMWRNETPNADQLLDQWMQKWEEQPEGDVLRTRLESVRHVGGSELVSRIEGIPGRGKATTLGEKMRETQVIEDAQRAEDQERVALQEKMIQEEFFAETPDQNLSAGSRDEKGFDYRGAQRREDRAAGPATVKTPMIQSLWNKLRGRTEQPKPQQEEPPEMKKAA